MVWERLRGGGGGITDTFVMFVMFVMFELCVLFRVVDIGKVGKVGDFGLGTLMHVLERGRGGGPGMLFLLLLRVGEGFVASVGCFGDSEVDGDLAEGLLRDPKGLSV